MPPVEAAISSSYRTVFVVGYAIATTTPNYSVQIAQFETIGVDGFSIQMIKPQGDSMGGGMFDMQVLDEGGSAIEVYYYMTMADDDVAEDGWYDEDMETFATRVFKRGEAYMINNCTGDDAQVQTAGQVNLAEVEVAFPQNYYCQGNFRPVDISIQDVVPLNPEGSTGGGMFDMQVLDEGGSAIEVYYYMTKDDDDVAEDGWYDEDMETFATRVFKPGEGFMLNNCTGADTTVKYLAK